ncbi:unnamed protein product [Arabis nemorensis]|uniref:Uncharacterized protein n=1 Tax=Arabis nemorensis TaxID=586526 RepID=A0A565CHM2_9BRAS|nr:unnamed protein product [Arabis nemorensis]
MNSRLSVSRLSLNQPGSKFGFSLDTKVRREFIVRAEDNNTEAESVDTEEEEVVESGEAKSPRKPRIKLGDIWGY